VILILPGPKKASPIYNQVKKYLIGELGIPSQGILAQTIQRGKGLRSICNKLLQQLCAKVGGVPWGID